MSFTSRSTVYRKSTQQLQESWLCREQFGYAEVHMIHAERRQVHSLRSSSDVGISTLACSTLL